MIKNLINVAISNRWTYYYNGFLNSPRLQECVAQEGFLRIAPRFSRT